MRSRFRLSDVCGEPGLGLGAGFNDPSTVLDFTHLLARFFTYMTVVSMCLSSMCLSSMCLSSMCLSSTFS